MLSSFKFSMDAIDVARLQDNLSHPSAGAVVTFEGRVRNHNEGQRVVRLEYEAFIELASKEGQRIIDEALKHHTIVTAHCVHRTGLLEIGEVAVWIGVSAGHRGAAFDACRYIIDQLKQRVPIWKKEHYDSGNSGWIHCDTTPNNPTSL